MQYHLNANHNNSAFDTKFCGQCLDDLPNLKKVTAYCKQCKEYICSDWCAKQHGKNRLTKKHNLLQHGELKIFQRRSCDLYVSPRGGGDDVISDESDDDILKSPPHLNAILKTEYNIRHINDREICSIHSSAVLQNGCIVLADLKNNNLKLLDRRKRETVFVYKLDNGPRDICASNRNKNELYAVETGILGIHQIKADTGMELVDTISTGRECFGVTCWSDGIAVIVSSDIPSKGNYELRILNYFGRVMQKIAPAKTAGLEFNLPWYLSANKDGTQIYVSDYGNNAVTGLNLTGSVLFVYKDANLKRPVSMAINGDGEIFVVGQRSHNIHHLSSTFMKKEVVNFHEALEFPGGFTYDVHTDNYYLQCTGWSDKLQEFVFTYQPMANEET